jgi:orotidine 5'-phosphate decarboxylase subfamily 1
MSTSPALVVALDLPEKGPALALATRLQGVAPWVKVGLELYLSAGQEILSCLKDMGFKVFLDLKFMDIPNTVQAAVAQSTRMGADMLTVHALGGRAMCEAAADGPRSGSCAWANAAMHPRGHAADQPRTRRSGLERAGLRRRYPRPDRSSGPERPKLETGRRGLFRQGSS